MVTPLQILQRYLSRVINKLGIAAMEVFVEAVELRRPCIRKLCERDWASGKPLPRGCATVEAALEQTPDIIDVKKASWIIMVCNNLGEKYEAVGNYRAAIPWYKKTLEQARLGVGGPSAEAISLSNLGVAQRNAGMLSAALASYGESLRASSLARLRSSHR